MKEHLGAFLVSFKLIDCFEKHRILNFSRNGPGAKYYETRRTKGKNTFFFARAENRAKSSVLETGSTLEYS